MAGVWMLRKKSYDIVRLNRQLCDFVFEPRTQKCAMPLNKVSELLMSRGVDVFQQIVEETVHINVNVIVSPTEKTRSS